MSAYEFIHCERVDGRARITLNRPAKHNARAPALLEELNHALWDADERKAVHCVILKGSGKLLQRRLRSDAGITDDAVVGFPPARGLGSQWAKRLTLTGDTITGEEAAQIGLAMKSVRPDLLARECEGRADRLALIDPDPLAANKRIVNAGLALMGARTLQRMAAENDARAHLAPATRVFRENVKRNGLKAALQERDAAFGDGRVRVNGPELRDENGKLVDP
jgi:enoyl-CoA hydratase/carnithine racemase